MNNVFEFLNYYKNVFEGWRFVTLSLIGFISFLIPSNQLSLCLKFLILISTFCLINIIALYKLWNEKNKKILLEMKKEYELILDKLTVLNLENTKVNEIKKYFTMGCNFLKEENFKIKNVILYHFNAYKIIYDFLKNYLQNSKTKIREVFNCFYIFEKNFKELEEYNKKIGMNENLSITEHHLRELIDNINDNLNFILSQF